MEKPRKKSKLKKALIISLSILLALILLALLFGYLYVQRMLNLIARPQLSETLSSSEIYAIENETDPPDSTFEGVVIDPTDVTWSTEPVEVIEGEEMIHILLIGQDRRGGQGRQRSDAMILCSLDTRTKTLTMTSFLRDLYVQIPGYQDNRLNAAYALGGMELLNETLKLNFGVQVDGNIEVDFSQFEQIINMLGGVDIDLTSAEANHINVRIGSGLHSGVNHLNGAEALAYSRIRYIGTDFGRTNRQRTVLSALLDKCRGLGITELHNLLEQVLPLITTDMSNGDIIDYALTCFPLISDITIKTQYIPAEGTYQFASIRGMSVILPDLEANRKLLQETLAQQNP